MASSIPKQYLPISGRPILQHTIERLAGHPRVAGLVAGIAAGDARFETLADCPVHAVTRAGAQRAETVFNGLDAIIDFAGSDDWVLVHDAVRPLVRREDIDRLIDAALPRVDGALLAVPVSDTVKCADTESRVERTLDRSRLWRAATPQMFPVGLLHDCLASALGSGHPITDEAGAMELAGYRPVLVECAADNLKITTPSDLELAEWLMARQS